MRGRDKKGDSTAPFAVPAPAAAFLPPQEKLPWVRLALRKIDTEQVLVQILWETKSLEDKHYILLATALTDIGKDLGGWNGKLTKQNSAPTTVGAKK